MRKTAKHKREGYFWEAVNPLAIFPEENLKSPCNIASGNLKLNNGLHLSLRIFSACLKRYIALLFETFWQAIQKFKFSVGHFALQLVSFILVTGDAVQTSLINYDNWTLGTAMYHTIYSSRKPLTVLIESKGAKTHFHYPIKFPRQLNIFDKLNQIVLGLS